MNKRDKEEIGKRLREARKNKKLSLERMGELLGVNQSTLSRYEHGLIDRLDIRKLKEMASILDVAPEWLIGWETQSQKQKNI